MDDKAKKELAAAAAEPHTLADYESSKLAAHNATRRQMQMSRAALDVPATHAPLPKPELVSNAETSVAALQETIATYAIELRRRANEGNINSKDGALVASLSTAAAKLAAEQREQESRLHLSLQSDEDIVRLVVDSVTATGPRGLAILQAALAKLQGGEAP